MHLTLHDSSSTSRLRPALLGVLAAVLIAGCDRGGGGTATTNEPGGESPLPVPGLWRPEPGPLPQFQDVTAESGIVFHTHASAEPPKNWLVETVGGGVVALDYDLDGDMDVLLVDGGGMARDGELVPLPGQGSRLFRNEGDLRFTDVTDEAGIDSTGYGLCGAVADYDRDGDPDLAVAGYDCFQLLRNCGDGRFEDVTAQCGVTPIAHNMTTGMAWGDLDGDGRLDLFLGNYVDQFAEVEKVRTKGLDPRNCKWREHVIYCGPKGLVPQRNQVFFQRAPGVFTEAPEGQPHEQPSYSFQPVLTDLDLDGDLDVYVPNDGEMNAVLVNDGTGKLLDRGVESGGAADNAFSPQASMGVDVADYDRDGRLDVFVTHFAHEHNTIYRNRTRRQDRPALEDRTACTGISQSPQNRLYWGTKLLDFDNDGVLDAFAAAGHVYPEGGNAKFGNVTYAQSNQLMRGLGPPGYRFEDVTERAGPHFADKRIWRGACFADFDDDGDWDVLVTALHDGPALLRNDGGNRNRWIRFDLRRKDGSIMPAGARVEVHLDAETVFVEELHLGSSFAGSNDPRILMGVGKAKTVPEVRVIWPGGGTQVLRDLPTNRTHAITEE